VAAVNGYEIRRKGILERPAYQKPVERTVGESSPCMICNLNELE